MKKARDIKKLLQLISSLSTSESLKIEYIFNNLGKMSNLHNMGLTEEEKMLLRRYQNKNYGNSKTPMDLKSSNRPRFEQ